MNKKILTFLFLVVFMAGFGTYIAKTNAATGGNSGSGKSGGIGGSGGGRNTLSNVFGWAWGATDEGIPPANTPNLGIGWIKMNSCNDVSPHDGLPDGGCVPTYGVQVDMSGSGKGNISGDAWSSNLGWISFNKSETGAPPTDDQGSVLATIDMSNGSHAGKVTGWARVLSACDSGVPCPTSGAGTNTGGWDGWIHLSDTTFHPTGPSYIDGSKGVTYKPAAGTIVGSAWGSDVVGWVKFVDVTLGASAAPFNYNLSNSGDLNITAEDPAGGTEVITRNYVAGTSEPVTISIPTPPPSGITATIVPTSNPCTPYCSSNIVVTAGSNVTPGTYAITVQGISQPSNVQRTTSFNVNVANATNGSLTVNCTVGSSPPYYINEPVTWNAQVTGNPGTPPYTAHWTFTNDNEPSGNADSPPTGNPISITQTYTKIGVKRATATVIDNSSPTPLPGVCTNVAQINVVVNPNITQK